MPTKNTDGFSAVALAKTGHFFQHSLALVQEKIQTTLGSPFGDIQLSKGGNAMPMYDYKCHDCGKEFLVALTLKEHESGPPFCPSCKSKNVEQLLTSFVAKTSRKS